MSIIRALNTLKLPFRKFCDSLLRFININNYPNAKYKRTIKTINNSCVISDVNNSCINFDDTTRSLFTTVCYCCDMVLPRERKSIGEIPSNAPRPQHRDIISTHSELL